jgi:hypothetical protein
MLTTGMQKSKKKHSCSGEMRQDTAEPIGRKGTRHLAQKHARGRIGTTTLSVLKSRPLSLPLLALPLASSTRTQTRRTTETAPYTITLLVVLGVRLVLAAAQLRLGSPT